MLVEKVWVRSPILAGISTRHLSKLFSDFLHLWVIAKSFKKWGFYKSSSDDISANKSCRHILEPSLEAPSIALNTLFSEKLFAHIRPTLLIFKILCIFEEKSAKYFFVKTIWSLKWILSLSRGTAYPKYCRPTSQLSNETRFVFLLCLV